MNLRRKRERRNTVNIGAHSSFPIGPFICLRNLINSITAVAGYEALALRTYVGKRLTVPLWQVTRRSLSAHRYGLYRYELASAIAIGGRGVFVCVCVSIYVCVSVCYVVFRLSYRCHARCCSLHHSVFPYVGGQFGVGHTGGKSTPHLFLFAVGENKIYIQNNFTDARCNGEHARAQQQRFYSHPSFFVVVIFRPNKHLGSSDSYHSRSSASKACLILRFYLIPSMSSVYNEQRVHCCCVLRFYPLPTQIYNIRLYRCFGRSNTTRSPRPTVGQ